MLRSKQIQLLDKKRALAKFTDRKILTSEFEKIYTSIKYRVNDFNPNVIFFYGLGGIGKSRLINEIKNNLKSKGVYNYASIDFKDQSIHTLVRTLISIRHSLKTSHSISFNHFDVAYAIYFARKNPDFIYKEQKLPFFDEIGLTGSIIGLFDGLSLFSSINNIANWIYKLSKKKFISRELKEELLKLKDKTIDEIEDSLLFFFAYDFKKEIANKKHPTPVIFIDTYEHLWKYDTTSNNRLDIDEWVRDIIINMPFALFVISGRDKLKWTEIDGEWGNYLNQYLLEPLSKPDTKEFLNSVGIHDGKLFEKIFEITKGHPYYIDLCIDTIYELKKSKKTININFGVTIGELYKLFSRNLKKSELDFLKASSLCRFFNEELYLHITQKLNIPLSFYDFNDITRFSFITKKSEKYFIHDLMRESLRLDFDSKQIILCAQTILDYYNEILSTVNDNYCVDKIEDYLSESLYIISENYNDYDYNNWLDNICWLSIKRLQLAASSAFLINFIETIQKKIHIQKIPLKILYVKIDMIHLQGNYKKAVSILEDILSNTNEKQILNSEELTYLDMRRIHHQMMYLPVPSLIKRILYLYENSQLNENSEVYGELLFMIGGNLGTLTGEYEFYRSYLYKALCIARKQNNIELLCRSIRKYCDYLKINNHLKYAEKLCLSALRKTDKHGLERYKLYLLCTLGDNYRVQKKYNESLKYFQKAKLLASKFNMKGWLGHVNIGIAFLYYQLSKIEQSLVYLMEAERYYILTDHSWGKLQVLVLKSFLAKKNNSNDLKNLVKQGIEISKYYSYKYEQKTFEYLNSDNHNIIYFLMFL